MLTLGDILDDLNAEEEQQSQHGQTGSRDSLSDPPVESFVAPIGTGTYLIYQNSPELEFRMTLFRSLACRHKSGILEFRASSTLA